jgi:hypothetical protein
MSATLCEGCQRARPKREPNLSAAGYIECRASEDAGELMQAFKTFATTRSVAAPFAVRGVPGHPSCAWPLQFTPDSISECDGRVPVAEP